MIRVAAEKGPDLLKLSNMKPACLNEADSMISQFGLNLGRRLFDFQQLFIALDDPVQIPAGAAAWVAAAVGARHSRALRLLVAMMTASSGVEPTAAIASPTHVSGRMCNRRRGVLI